MAPDSHEPPASAPPPASTTPPAVASAPFETGTDGAVVAKGCLCVFDIDRTLTGKQGDATHCHRNRVLNLPDEAYGGGLATLSALTNEGISKTFCNNCYLGITSAGTGSGADSSWNSNLMTRIITGDVHDVFMRKHPEGKRWSYGTNVNSPFVLGQHDRFKQDAVELVRRWYNGHGANTIAPEDVWFFDDRTENIEPFGQKGFNSREISCLSRDTEVIGGVSGMIGYCGAEPEEIQQVKGNVLCKNHVFTP